MIGDLQSVPGAVHSAFLDAVELASDTLASKPVISNPIENVKDFFALPPVDAVQDIFAMPEPLSAPADIMALFGVK